MVEESRRQAKLGAIYGVGAYLSWGLVPIYFKAVKTVPPLEILAHRVVWSLLLTSLLLLGLRNWRVALTALLDKTVLIRLVVTTALIAANWYVFIWAMEHDQVLQASLGYFINPLVNVLLGFLFLRERLRRWQTVSVLLAGVGVAYMVIGYGQLPWIALTLAFTFGFYGLLRKTAKVGSLVGLNLETTLLTPLALGYILYLAGQNTGNFATVSWSISVLLAFSGVITTVPLLLFASAALRLRYATIGFLQYLAPSMQFTLAVLVYGELFTLAHLISFGCIWIALGIYSADTIVASRANAGATSGRNTPTPNDTLKCAGASE